MTNDKLADEIERGLDGSDYISLMLPDAEWRQIITALRSERPQSGEMVMVLKDRLPRLVELIDAEIRRSIQYCDEHSHSLHVQIRKELLSAAEAERGKT